VSAASALLDRGFGRPAQVHSDGDGGPIRVIIHQIIDHEEPRLVIEHEPLESVCADAD
jgi:hypothetical protein